MGWTLMKIFGWEKWGDAEEATLRVIDVAMK
jgi:hypothetical protein